MKHQKTLDDSMADCARCGDSISTCWGTCFAFDGRVLCFECASALGGRYSVWSGTWTVSPDIERIERQKGNPVRPRGVRSGLLSQR